MAQVKADYTRKYLTKVNARLDTINKQDPFFDICKNAIDGGENIYFQKYRLETRIFDLGWIDKVEMALDKIDNIIRKPRSFIKDNSVVVSVEKVKRTGPESIRHLATHTQYIKEVDKNGFVLPSKVLSNDRDLDLAIYENRFVKTLLERLVPFVDKRTDALSKLLFSDYFNKVYSKSNFKFGDMDVEYELNMIVHKKMTDDISEKQNMELLERATTARNRVIGLYNSDFMKKLSSAKPVKPPIQKTNLILNEPNYSQCYKLWLYISSQGEFKYDIDVKAAESKFSDEYKEQVKQLTMLSFATALINDPESPSEFNKNIIVPIRPKQMKVLQDIKEEARDNTLEMESHLINEFYYQEARKLYRRSIDSKVNDGEPYHVALKDVYMTASKITDNLFNSLLEMPEDLKDNPVAALRYKKRKLVALKTINKYKLSDYNKAIKANARLEKEIQKDTKLVNKLLGIVDPEEVAKEKAKQKALELKAKEKAKLEADKLKQKEQEQKTKEKAKQKAIELKAKEKAKLEAEKLKQKEQEQKAKEKAKEKAKLEAEKLKQKEQDQKAKEKAKEKAKLEAEKLKQKEQDQKAKEKAKEKAKLEAERLKQKEQEQKAKEKAKEKAKLEAEKLKQKEQDQKAKQKAKEKAKLEAERLKQKEQEQKAKEKAKEKAKLEAEKLKQKEKEQKAKEKAKEKAKQTKKATSSTDVND